MLDNRVIVAGNRYADLPEALRQHMLFGFGVNVLGEPQHSQRFRWAALNNERITLSFKPATTADEAALEALLPEGEITDISQLPTSIPAYLINVVPELKVNDNVVLSGTPMSLGEELTFVFTPELARKRGPKKGSRKRGPEKGVSTLLRPFRIARSGFAK